MKQLFILVMVLALGLGVLTNCDDGKVIPTPLPTGISIEPAPGAYIPLTSIAWSGLVATNSAGLAAKISDETGTGYLVLGTSPSITTPTIATPTITGTLIGGAFTTITSATWNGTSIGYLYEASRTSAQQSVVISDETGSGVMVFGTSPTIGSPTITTPAITTPTITGNTSMYTVTSGTWQGTSVAYTYEADRTSAQQALRISDETGTGLVVFGTSPTITTPTITGPTITGNTSMYTITSGTWNGSSIGFLYMQLTSGVTDIAVGDTACSVTHSLGTTPQRILLSWQNEQPLSVVASQTMIWSSLPTSTVFTINITSALSNRPSIAWMAIP